MVSQEYITWMKCKFHIVQFQEVAILPLQKELEFPGGGGLRKQTILNTSHSLWRPCELINFGLKVNIWKIICFNCGKVMKTWLIMAVDSNPWPLWLKAGCITVMINRDFIHSGVLQSLPKYINYVHYLVWGYSPWSVYSWLIINAWQAKQLWLLWRLSHSHDLIIPYVTY